MMQTTTDDIERTQERDRRRARRGGGAGRRARITCARCGAMGPTAGAPEDPHQTGWLTGEGDVLCPTCAR